ncbi:YqgE/AlgH family protein [Litorimonas sp. RW-G-Af-16]|uniref:YqgE/AlgH family protein n=1 Tax=Litorimonas sp. RW-G-Af-16 TaxID=3241168 RepID=UPI00390C7E58
MTDHPTYAGHILLATPDMGDPRFTKSVIYICSHDAKGAMGIMINKSEKGLHLSELLEKIDIEGDLRVADSPVLSGGPVDIDRGFVLHSPDYFIPDVSSELSDTLSMTATKDVLRALVSDDSPDKAMLAVGYAGWSAGQLESEIMQNAWLVTEADEALIFESDLDGKWTKALSGMGISPEMLSRSGGRA